MMPKLRLDDAVQDYEPRTLFKGRTQLVVTSRREEQSARGHGWTDRPPDHRPKRTDDDRLAGR